MSNMRRKTPTVPVEEEAVDLPPVAHLRTMLHFPTRQLLDLSQVQSNCTDPSRKAFTVSAADQFGRRLFGTPARLQPSHHQCLRETGA